MGAKIGLQKIEEKDMQFLIENIFAKIENKKPYETKTEKESEIMMEIEKNYRCVYQVLFYEILYTVRKYFSTWWNWSIGRRFKS